MAIVITGGTGMLGRTLSRRLAARQPVSLGSTDLDIGDAQSCDAVIARHRPQLVLHCAAMTAVDRCESERESAFRVNALGSANIAAACARHGARLVAFSTDYVFAGDLPRPYREDDAPGARTVYGASKLAGEQAVRELCPDHLIVRVAWLYGPGGPSFIHTMLKLGAQQGPALKVVDDQIGNPTSTDAVADALMRVLDADVTGILHVTCEGEASWYRLAQEVFSLRGFTRPLTPCTTAEFPRPAPRPANSRLEKAALRLQGCPPVIDWRVALHRFLKDYPHG